MEQTTRWPSWWCTCMQLMWGNKHVLLIWVVHLDSLLATFSNEHFNTVCSLARNYPVTLNIQREWSNKGVAIALECCRALSVWGMNSSSRLALNPPTKWKLGKMMKHDLGIKKIHHWICPTYAARIVLQLEAQLIDEPVLQVLSDADTVYSVISCILIKVFIHWEILCSTKPTQPVCKHDELMPLIEVTASSMSASYNGPQGQPCFKNKQIFRRMRSKSINCAIIKTHRRAKAQTVKECLQIQSRCKYQNTCRRGTQIWQWKCAERKETLKTEKHTRGKNTCKKKNERQNSKMRCCVKCAPGSQGWVMVWKSSASLTSKKHRHAQMSQESNKVQ